MKHPTLSAEEREVIRDWLTKPKDSAEYRTAMRRVWNLLPPETSRPTEFNRAVLLSGGVNLIR